MKTIIVDIKQFENAFGIVLHEFKSSEIYASIVYESANTETQRKRGH